MTGDPLDVTSISLKQNIANSDTNGRETISAPKAGLRFATSDTTAMMMPDKAHLATK
jgi:hypothetical protein